MKINKNILIKFFFTLFLLNILISCNKETISYKPLKLQDEKEVIVTTDILYVYFAVKTGKKIFVRSADIWVVDIDKKTEKKLFKIGAAPDEIYKPNRITHFNNRIFVNSVYPIKHFYSFSEKSGQHDLKRVSLPKALAFDDFDFISEDLLAVANVYWEDGLVKLINLKTGNISKIGESKITGLMLEFNVNRASLCIMEGNLYVAQRTKPEIQVISLADKKILKTLKLSPPFYKPVPKKRKIEKYDHKAHKKWMAKWSGVSDIMCKRGWLLLKYRWGYDLRFCYELVNVRTPDKRLYIGETSKSIYAFDVNGNKISFDFSEQTDEQIQWKKATVSI